jgi:hypothetical protein
MCRRELRRSLERSRHFDRQLCSTGCPFPLSSIHESCGMDRPLLSHIPSKPNSGASQSTSLIHCFDTDSSIVIDVNCLLKCLIWSKKNIPWSHGIFIEKRNVQERGIDVGSLSRCQSEALAAPRNEHTDLYCDNGPVEFVLTDTTPCDRTNGKRQDTRSAAHVRVNGDAIAEKCCPSGQLALGEGRFPPGVLPRLRRV